MRNDMFKVIVERPRQGGGWGAPVRHRSRIDVEDAGPDHESVRSPHRKHRKYLNENLNPLKRFLSSAVGRHWDKVYAEICEQLSVDSTVKLHVRDHLSDYVALRTGYVNGALWCLGETGWQGPQPLATSRKLFFVHPRSGVLLRNRPVQSYDALNREKRLQAQALADRRRRVISESLQLHLLGGQWYEVRLVPRPKDAEGAFDAIRDRGFSSLSAEELYGHSSLRAESKRQLGRKELQAFGLL